MKYCKNCKRKVNPTKKFSKVWFIINCCWLIGGLFYIIYYCCKDKVCPMCGSCNFRYKPKIKKADNATLRIGVKTISSDDTWANIIGSGITLV